MRFIKYILLITGFFSLSLSGFTQQAPVFSQYMINKFLVNPAVVGGNGLTDINMVVRQQYQGFTNPPRTFGVMAQTRLLNDSYIMKNLRIKKDLNQATRFTNVGVGGSIFSDRNGIVTKTGLQFAYAYHINFNNAFQLSMGLSGSAVQYKLDDSNSFLVDTDDPVLLGDNKQFWVPDASFGLYITNSIWYGGATITDLLGSSLKLGSDPIKDNFSSVRNYLLMGGYRFDLNESFTIEPSLLFRTTSLSTQLDINTRVSYNKSYWMGFSYRTDKTIVSMIGVNVDMFHFGYAYDASFGSVHSYTAGSHEILFGVLLGEKSTRRFRWVNKDEMEFDM